MCKTVRAIPTCKKIFINPVIVSYRMNIHRVVNIFIIHSERDRDTLRSLIFEYKDIKFGTNERPETTTLNFYWIDTHDQANLGADFVESIKEQIQRADMIFVIITRNCWNSVWVNQEIGYTFGISKLLIPIKERDIETFGFIHGNIDAQLFDYGRLEFNRLDIFLESNYGSKMRAPETLKPIPEYGVV